MEQPNMREQHLQADADSARQQSYNMAVEARLEKAKADRLRAVNAKLLAALEAAEKEADYHGCNNCRYIHKLARDAIQEAKK